jgi:hypothetical protein
MSLRGAAAAERTPVPLRCRGSPPCVVWAARGLPHTESEAPSPVLIHIRGENLGLKRLRAGRPSLDEAWGLLTEARVPVVVVHAGHAPVGTEYTGPAIVARLGAPDYRPFLRMAADYERVAGVAAQGVLGQPGDAIRRAGGGRLAAR